MAQQEIRNNACRDRNQYVVAARLNPLIPARRGAEIVAAPVIDYVIAVAVFGWQAIAAVVLVVGAHAAALAAFLLVRASEAAIVVLVCRSDRTLRPFRRSDRTLRLLALLAAVFVSVAVALREGKLRGGHCEGDDGGNSCFAAHLNSKYIGKPTTH